MSSETGVKIEGSSWARDLVIAAVVTIAGTVALIQGDMFDYLHAVSRDYEDWNLDEIILGLGVLALASVWFAWRRQREARRHFSTRAALERDLRKSHGELSFLISAAPGVLYTCQPEGDFGATFVSPSVKAQHGYDPSEFTSDAKFWADRIHPEDQERVFAEMAPLFERGHHVHEYRFRHADGSYRWMHDQLTLFRDANDKPERIVGFWHDITDRKEFERRLTVAVAERTAELNRMNQALQQKVEARRKVAEALKEREEQSTRLIESLPGFVYVCDCDEDWTMRFVSEGAQAILGYPPDDLIGNRVVAFGDLIHPDDRAAIWAAAESNLAARKPGQYEYRIETASGSEITVWEHSHGVYDGAGKVVRIEGYIEDITDRKQAEERLRQAQRMEAVGQLTGGVAHDFNNLLAVIMGNSELLGDRLGSEDKLLNAIQRAATRGSELTQRLLAFSRRQSLRPQALDLGVLVSGMSQLLTRTLGETMAIETSAAPGLWRASADPGQVENALLNLALNARDAMPGGGKLTIACANACLDEAYAAQNPEAGAGDYVALAVCDSGMGMSAEIQAKAFDPFYTTKEVGKGSGLGLSMVYGFAKQSGGHVTIYSEIGRGTTVKLYLPRAKQAPRSEIVPQDVDIPRGRDEVILVIEDDPEVRDLAVRSLEGLGYRAIEVPDAAEARMLLAGGARFDLVLSDVVLPGGTSGPEFAEEARATHPDLKIIFMSGYPAEAAKRNGFLDSDNTLLNKPFQRQHLAKALREALD